MENAYSYGNDMVRDILSWNKRCDFIFTELWSAIATIYFQTFPTLDTTKLCHALVQYYPQIYCGNGIFTNTPMWLNKFFVLVATVGRHVRPKCTYNSYRKLRKIVLDQFLIILLD